VLPGYLKVLLTEWDSGCYQARTATVVAHLQNHRVLHEMLADLLMRKASWPVHLCDIGSVFELCLQMVSLS